MYVPALLKLPSSALESAPFMSCPGVAAGVNALILNDLFCPMRASCSCSWLSLPNVPKDSLCIDPLRSWKARPLAMEKDDAWRGS